MLVICLIVAILSGIALPNYRRALERSRVAEAQTLLRAIYDSCERLAWEKGLSSCFAGVAANRVSFAQLDTLAKGSFGNQGKSLQTENFLYELTNTAVTATATKGNYSGAKISFNGQLFTCTNAASGEGATACTAWAASRWNE